MRKTIGLSLFIALSLSFLFTSCDNSEITKLSINKSNLTLNVGQSDSLTATISYTGDLGKQTIEWIVSDTTIVTTSPKSDGSASIEKKESVIERNIFLKAKKAGTTTVTLKTGSKSIDCKITVTQRNLVFTTAAASNWGDYYDIGTNNFVLIMYESGLTRGVDGKFSGTGNYMFFDFNLPITQNSLYNSNFTASDKGDVNTFFQGEYYTQNGETNIFGSFLGNLVKGKTTQNVLKDGSFKITKKNEGYVIEGDVTLENDEVIHFIYDGAITITDKRDVAEIKPALTHGLLFYLGDAYGTGKANNFLMYLASETLNFQDSLSKGDLLALEINTSLMAKDSIPNGTYLTMSELSNEKILPFTLIPAYYSKENDEYGTWFYGEKIIKKIKSGNIKTTKTGKIYNISYELYDRFGAKVWGTYTGELKYTDVTKKNVISGVKKVGSASKLKNLPVLKRQINKMKVRY